MTITTGIRQNRLDRKTPLVRCYPLQWVRWFLVLTLALWTVPAQGEEFRYRYVPFGVPPGFDFFDPAAINDSGQVSGTVYKCDEVSCVGSVAIYEDGTITVLHPGYSGPIDARGTIGGAVDVDPVNFTTQATLFRENRVKLIPPQPGEYTSGLWALNDSGTALLFSYDEAFNLSRLLYKNGRSTVLDFGPIFENVFPEVTGMNNQDIMSGRATFPPGVFGPFSRDRGFRFDPKTGETLLLNPVETDLHTWGLDINTRGDILGYSFRFSGIERIGVWDRNGEFTPYFVEGTPEFPTISNRLVFNDHNLIVISRVRTPASEAGNCYLVPKPGVRLNLADLVENLPPGVKLFYIQDINNHGDILGLGFLLERIGVADH